MRNYPFARGHVRIKKAEPIKPAEKVVEEVKEEIPHTTSALLPVIKEDVVSPANEEAMVITTEEVVAETAAEEQPIPKKKKKKNSFQK